MSKEVRFGRRKSKAERTVALEDLLEFYKQIGRAPIRERFGIPSCTMGSRVTLTVLEHFGFAAQYMSVRAIIFNPKFEPLRKAAGMSVVDTVPSGGRPDVFGHPDAKCVILGPEKFDINTTNQAHLVVIADGRYLVDSSLDQANSDINQHDLGIQLPGVFYATVTEAFLSGGTNVIRDPVNGCRMIYESFPDDRAYLQDFRWGQQREDVRDVASQLIVELEFMVEQMVKTEDGTIVTIFPQKSK